MREEDFGYQVYGRRHIRVEHQAVRAQDPGFRRGRVAQRGW